MASVLVDVPGISFKLDATVLAELRETKMIWLDQDGLQLLTVFLEENVTTKKNPSLKSVADWTKNR